MGQNCTDFFFDLSAFLWNGALVFARHILGSPLIDGIFLVQKNVYLFLCYSVYNFIDARGPVQCAVSL